MKSAGLAAAAVLALVTGTVACVPQGASRRTGTSTAKDATAASADTYLGAGAARGALFDTLAAQLKASERSPEAGLARLGTTWDKELARTRERFLAARTVEDAYLAILSLKISFHDAHSELDHEPGSGLRNLPQALVPTRPPVALRASLRVEYDGATPRYVLDAPDAPPESVVTAVDGKDLATLRAALVEWYPFHSPDGLDAALGQWLIYRDPRQGPAPQDGDSVTLTVQAPGAAPQQIKMTWGALQQRDGAAGLVEASGGQGASPLDPRCQAPQGDVDADYTGRTAEWSAGNVCVYPAADAQTRIVRYFSFNYPDRQTLDQEQAALMTYLRGAHVTRVLFDVRENGGGDFDPVFFANFTASPYKIPVRRLVYLPVFRNDPSQLANVDGAFDPMTDPVGFFRSDMTAHPTAAESPGLAFFCKTAACGPDEATYAPAAGAPAPLSAAVLTGPDCVSSCDDFVTIMKDNGIAPLVGLPSAGGDAPYKLAVPARLADGSTFDWRLTVGVSSRPDAQGTVLEAHPPEVDHPLRRTAANRGRFLDAALGTLGWTTGP